MDQFLSPAPGQAQDSAMVESLSQSLSQPLSQAQSQPVDQSAEPARRVQTEGARYSFSIHTFGCKVNTYDTGLLQKRLEAKGHQISNSLSAKGGERITLANQNRLDGFGLGRRVPKIHVLNTCAVTHEATKEAAKTARRLKAKDPFSTIVITGCGAQVDGEIFDTLTAADLVIANSHKGDLENILDRYFSGTLTSDKDDKSSTKPYVFRSNIFRKDDVEAGGGIEAGHTRSFLKIQDGCNSFCTYCVIPFARGKSRSIAVSDLVKRVRELRQFGAGEVVLTGVHIGDYEDDRNGRKLLLQDLVSEILERTDVPRLRLSSLEPPELTPELLALYKNERMCAHFHMSIQSANARILHSMRRKYDASAVEEALHAISREVPNAFVGMDVIVGFPGETEDEFADTYERLSRLPWTRIHVFPYSERPGTKAAQFEGAVPRDIRSLRSQRLRELSALRFDERARAQVGTEKTVLILKAPGRGAEGLSRDYWPVRIRGEGANGELCGDLSDRDTHLLAELAGREIKVRILRYDDSRSSRVDGVLEGVWLKESEV